MAKYGEAIKIDYGPNTLSENVIMRAMYVLGLQLHELLEIHQFEPKEIKVYYEFESDKPALSTEEADKRFKELHSIKEN